MSSSASPDTESLPMPALFQASALYRHADMWVQPKVHSQLVSCVTVQISCILYKQSSDVATRQDRHWLDGDLRFESCL